MHHRNPIASHGFRQIERLVGSSQQRLRILGVTGADRGHAEGAGDAKQLAFITDVATWPRWQAGLVEVKNISTDPLATGAAYTVVAQMRQRTFEAHYTVTAFETTPVEG